ncbi:MAG: GIY-YIG nuclease family protein [Chitinophagales bacterium]
MKLHHNYFVYIVQCADGTYYTGVTNDLERRLVEHNTGDNVKSYTYNRRPVVLKHYDHFMDINQAIAWEKQVKGWSRKKKEALFRNNWNDLIALSKNKATE